MNAVFHRTAAAIAIGLGINGLAHADSASTTGGIKIKSDDGNFEASVGGRIHFDGALTSADTDTDSLGISSKSNASSFYFRRVFLSLRGKAYGWEYRVEEDFSATGSPASGFQEVWIGHSVFGNDALNIGQRKPWRSLDEIASNNNTVFLERNILSANGLFGGRDYTQGLFYQYARNGLWAGASLYTDGKSGSTSGRSFGANGRLAYAPIIEKTRWLHTGISYSFDNVSPDGDGFAKLAPGYSTWYGKKGNAATLVSFSNATPTPGNELNAGTGTAELAAAFGPAYLQGEYGVTHQWASAGKTATVDAYSVTLAYALTGETRPYDTGGASYGGIKPTHVYGAFEVAARYDSSKNKDASTCALRSADAETKCSISSITVGLNYYANPNVRFMLDYQYGKADDGVRTDSPDSVAARAQFVF